MKCTYCNAELEPGSKFCDNCGGKVEETPIQTPASSGEGMAAPSFAPYSPAPVVEPSPSPVFKSYTPSSPSSKVMGIDSDKMGLIAIILGAVGLVLSCVGCGFIISILGAVAGFFSLKTPNRSQGIIGLVLSGLGILIGLVFICIYLFAFISSLAAPSYSYY
jgi:hypothetical protein